MIGGDASESTCVTCHMLKTPKFGSILRTLLHATEVDSKSDPYIIP